MEKQHLKNEIEKEYAYNSIYDQNKNIRNNKTIFISIPCYRDPEVVNTIKSAIDNAKNPDRIFFGIDITYLKDIDPEFWKEISNLSYVKIITNEASIETVGIGRQRNRAFSLFDNQDYVLQIDAHMRFDINWDDLLIRHYESIKSMETNKIAITGYPRGYAPESLPDVPYYYPYYNPKSRETYFRERRGHNNVPCFRKGHHAQKYFTTFGFPRHGDRRFSENEVLALAPGCSASQIFAEPIFFKDVVLNDAVFFLEEEEYMSALAFMKGYNFYVPRVTGIMHYYTESGDKRISDRPLPTDDIPELDDLEVYLKNSKPGKTFMDSLKNIKNPERSFKEYEEFAGLDYSKRKFTKPVDEMKKNSITSYVNFCSELYEYSINQYINWMYEYEYDWRQDVIQNEG